jgi:hypothetical protein
MFRSFLLLPLLVAMNVFVTWHYVSFKVKFTVFYQVSSSEQNISLLLCVPFFFRNKRNNLFIDGCIFLRSVVIQSCVTRVLLAVNNLSYPPWWYAGWRKEWKYSSDGGVMRSFTKLWQLMFIILISSWIRRQIDGKTDSYILLTTSKSHK